MVLLYFHLFPVPSYSEGIKVMSKHALKGIENISLKMLMRAFVVNIQIVMKPIRNLYKNSVYLKSDDIMKLKVLTKVHSFLYVY